MEKKKLDRTIYERLFAKRSGKKQRFEVSSKRMCGNRKLELFKKVFL